MHAPGILHDVRYVVQGGRVAVRIGEPLEAGDDVCRKLVAEVSSGMYFYQLITGEESETRKMMLVK